MMDDLVSVIIPVYNVEAYLDDCIRSVRGQTYENLEIIIVNDKTPDHSMEIARRHAREDSRIAILEHEVNRGLGAARNTGIGRASGRYVMFLDSDDRYTRDAVELLYDKLCESGAQFACGRMMWQKETGIVPVEYIDQRLTDMTTHFQSNARHMHPDKWFLGQVCNRIFDKAWLDKKGIRFPEGVFWEDMLFSAKAWIEAENICCVEDIVYLRTERDDESNPSITQAYGKKKYLDRDKLVDGLLDYLCAGRERYLSGEEGQSAISLYEVQRLIKRVCATTQNMIPRADEEIKPWVEKWYQEHDARCQKLLQDLK